MNNRIEEFIDKKTREFREELIRIAEEENKPKTIYDLEDGDKYFYLDSIGDIYLRTFYDAYVDIELRGNGNVFLTREEAEFELERRRIETVMRKYSRPFEEEEENWSICYDRYHNTVDITYWGNTDHGLYYFKSREVTQQVINEIGKERLKKYWFRVEE